MSFAQHNPFRSWLTQLFTVGVLALHNLTLWAAPPPVQFNRDVRPILTDNCFSCHGPDKAKRKASLRLDTRDGLFSESKGTFPVVPGHPQQSEIYRRLITHDPDELMPKTKLGEGLPAAQIETIRRWINQGAKWQGHWAYTVPERPAIPALKRSSWPVNPVDRFILARLQKEKLTPSPDANRRILLRRLSFDLTGLPPTLAAVEQFANDKNPRAYENEVDRLLASPHYGERMAENWLDEVRYADTDGFHADNYRSVYPYRDYVIHAFNDNMKFDQFTREQLAGDLLTNSSVQQKTASTFNRLTRSTEEGGAQPKEYLAKYAADRVRTVSEVWLGSTMGCCECHDHKFDPFTTKDFYAFEAFFADIQEQGVGVRTTVMIPDQAQAAELEVRKKAVAVSQAKFDIAGAAETAAQTVWEKKLVAPLLLLSAWTNAGSYVTNSPKVAFNTAFPPEQILTNGPISNATRALTNGELPGLLKTTNTATYLSRSIYSATAQVLPLFVGGEMDLKIWLNGKSLLKKEFKPTAKAEKQMLTAPLRAGDNTILVKVVSGNRDPGFYFDLGAPGPTLAALALPPEKRSTAQIEDVGKFFHSVDTNLAPVRTDLEAAQARLASFSKTVPTTLVTVAGEPRVTRVLPRGNWMSEAGDIVTPAVPAFLPQNPLQSRRATRLDLADWIVSPQNPLTARVFVNRLWKLYFGIGLSKTLDDFGTRGEWPAHPELLDYLATEFVDSGWDVKHMVKLMVMSHTYRQSAVATPKLRERDPDNRLLARQSSFRLDAEMVRDNALAVSGLLVNQVGGPSVKPYQPEGYWDQLNFPKRTYVADHGDALYRRGLYTFWCRTFLQPSMQAFDAPSREECTIERVNSNTPLQALALLNDPTYVEAARGLAEELLRRPPSSVEDRVNWTFNQTLDRKPAKTETQLLLALYDQEKIHYMQNLPQAKALLGVGEHPAPKDVNVVELAAWTEVARAVLNLNETITRY